MHHLFGRNSELLSIVFLCVTLSHMSIVAGIVAGILAVDGGILGGLIIGILAGVLAYYISVFCFRHNVPGTTVNIASGGLGGLAAGLVGKFLIAPVAL